MKIYMNDNFEMMLLMGCWDYDLNAYETVHALSNKTYAPSNDQLNKIGLKLENKIIK